ncbi:arginine-glutamic acid dipeptide repeats protein-like, partial [Octopus bimaculoides]|uniref:arginine-glutamic acid dipeptide repeats protein-like n=1 Tax=Octopus bimaculoides TaxID=37653 RepID=UPI0022E98CBB
MGPYQKNTQDINNNNKNNSMVNSSSNNNNNNNNNSSSSSNSSSSNSSQQQQQQQQPQPQPPLPPPPPVSCPSSNQTTDGSGGSQRTTRKSQENKAENGHPVTSGEDSDEAEEITFIIQPTKKNGKTKTGTILRRGDEVISFTFEDVIYKAGDCVYVDSCRADQPHYICTIQNFRITKRDTLVVNVKWYYRPSEVPYNVYQYLVQDRHTETKSGIDLAIKDPLISSRELFISDVCDTYQVATLRGRCKVQHFKDIVSAREFKPVQDSFFYILGYNPESKRLATTQGEIRVGTSHQARLPEYKRDVSPSDMPEKSEHMEELRWRPLCVIDGELMMYLSAARLHLCHYDTGKALQALVKCPVPRGIEKKWTDDETKRFIKGLRQYGKNFFKIRKELLPHRETGELVEYYYFWKKTPAGITARPHRRHRRQSGLKRQTTRSQRPPSSEFYLSSASEISDNDSDDSEGRDLSGYSCRRCFTTTSKDWHHAGKDKALLCTDCRLFFKKYGEDRPVVDSPPDPPPFLFKPVQEDETINGKHNMRTRRSRESAGKSKKKDRHSTSSPDNIDSPLNSSSSSQKITGRKSPSTVSTCSNSSTDRDKKTTTATTRLRKGTSESPVKSRKRQHHLETDKFSKKKKPQGPSDSESVSDSSSISGNEENGNEGDIENNQDDLSSNSPPSTPSPADNLVCKPQLSSQLPATISPSSTATPRGETRPPSVPTECPVPQPQTAAPPPSSLPQQTPSPPPPPPPPPPPQQQQQQ